MTLTERPSDDSSVVGESTKPTFDELARRVDEARSAAERLEDDVTGDAATGAAIELADAVEAFHRPVLVDIVRTLRNDPRGKELLFGLVDDPHVRAVLALHGIIKPPAPPAEPVPPADAPIETIIPISSIRRRTRSEVGWVEGPAVDDLDPSRLHRVDVPGDEQGPALSFVVTRSRAGVHVFANACVHQGMSLDGGLLGDGVITCPWHGFTFDAATGDCISSPGAQLTSVPSRVDGGRLWIRARTS
ncbi:MAG: Rieske (2Fe-2S) protein [Actinomycetota bacterium]